MPENKLAHNLSGFARWKSRQLATMNQLEPWLKQQGLFTSEAQRALQQARNTLSQDNITVAVVGEFSRGKTELINALFFGDQEFRLLPTDAGRTTMCPTEIFQDDDTPPYLRLLPIETRLEDISLKDLRKQSASWVKIPLNTDDPAQLHTALLKIKENRTVSMGDAEQMGFASETIDDAVQVDSVEIPAWRLAELNFRHPLLAQGLRVLDTPGLNAVSAEPELTYEILPSAQARLFVLGADTGVTQSDLDMWQQLVRRPGSKQQPGVMVVLNKTDTLWDELRSSEEIENTINRQRREVADILGVNQQQVFALSAQKALVGRIKRDPELEKRSGILEMEWQMAQLLVNNRQELIMEQSTEQVCSAIKTIETLVSSRFKRMQQQAEGLTELSTKSEGAITEMLHQTQLDREKYQASINAYKASRKEFTSHGKLLLGALSMRVIDEIIATAKRNMTSAWTTRKLKASIRQMFDDINQHMQTASNQSQEMRRLIRTIHRRFESRHDMNLGEPKMFSIISHQVELNMVHQESEIFRKSRCAAFTEQHLLTRRYFQTVVRRIEEVFHSAHNDAKDWLETALDPLTIQVHEHRSVLSEQLDDLKHIRQSRSTVKQRVTTLKHDTKRLQGQLISLKNVVQTLRNRELPEKDGRVKPKLVKKSA